MSGRQEVISRLDALMLETDEFCEEAGAGRPTDYAISYAKRLVNDFTEHLPVCIAHTTYEGGIRMYWKKEDFDILVAIAGSDAGQSYIYAETSTGINILPLSTEALSEILMKTFAVMQS